MRRCVSLFLGRRSRHLGLLRLLSLLLSSLWFRLRCARGGSLICVANTWAGVVDRLVPIDYCRKYFSTVIAVRVLPWEVHQGSAILHGIHIQIAIAIIATVSVFVIVVIGIVLLVVHQCCVACHQVSAPMLFYVVPPALPVLHCEVLA